MRTDCWSPLARMKAKTRLARPKGPKAFLSSHIRLVDTKTVLLYPQISAGRLDLCPISAVKSLKQMKNARKPMNNSRAETTSSSADYSLERSDNPLRPPRLLRELLPVSSEPRLPKVLVPELRESRDPRLPRLLLLEPREPRDPRLPRLLLPEPKELRDPRFPRLLPPDPSDPRLPSLLLLDPDVPRPPRPLLPAPSEPRLPRLPSPADELGAEDSAVALPAEVASGELELAVVDPADAELTPAFWTMNCAPSGMSEPVVYDLRGGVRGRKSWRRAP